MHIASLYIYTYPPLLLTCRLINVSLEVIPAWFLNYFNICIYVMVHFVVDFDPVTFVIGKSVGADMQQDKSEEKHSISIMFWIHARFYGS